MRFVSLFSGIGGMDLGLERAGWTCMAQVEIDEFCRRVLEKHWPDVPRFGDVREVGAEDFGAVDAVVGGPPCQPASVAGKRKGSADERWLWGEFLRLCRECRPRWIVAENPLGIVGLKPHGLEWIVEELERAGYEVLPVVVGADDAGAPHRRKRVFVLAHFNSERERDAGQHRRLERTSGEGSTDARGGGAVVADVRGARLEAGRPLSLGTVQVLPVSSGGCRAFPKGQGPDQWEWEEPRVVEFPVGCSTNGLPERLARKRWRDWNADSIKALGNAVVPQVAEVIGRAILSSIHGAANATNKE